MQFVHKMSTIARAHTENEVDRTVCMTDFLFYPWNELFSSLENDLSF